MTTEEKKEIVEFHINRIKELGDLQQKAFNKLVKELNVKKRVDFWFDLCFNEYGDARKEIELLNEH